MKSVERDAILEEAARFLEDQDGHGEWCEAAEQIRALKTTPAPAETGRERLAKQVGVAIANRADLPDPLIAPAVSTDETCDHNWRSSDSSLYDFKCTKCGETE